MNLLSYSRLIAAMAVASVSLITLRPVPARGADLSGKKVLLVVGEADEDRPTDDVLVKSHLESLGLTVAMVNDEAALEQAKGVDLVVLSASVNPYAISREFKSLEIPILTWSAPTYPILGMTGSTRHNDFEIIEPVHHFQECFTDLYGYCVNPTNPIAMEASLPAKMFGTMYLLPTETNWGKPGIAAQVIAVYEGNRDKAALFTYEKGATLYDGSVAAARRASFYLGASNFHYLTAVHGPAENDDHSKTWYVGLKLFDATVRWALAQPITSSLKTPAAIHAALAAAAAGKTVLYVDRLLTPEGKEADDHNVAYLQALGFKVKVADQDDAEVTTGNVDLVVLSATCSKYKLNGKYGDSKFPVMCHEGLCADTLHMAGLNRYHDYGEHGEEKESEDPPEAYLEIVNAWHPLAAGFPAGPVQVIKEADVLKWATPTRSAIVIATLPYASHQAAIFGYEKGAVMTDQYIAPARKLLFPLDNPAFDDLTPNGLALYDASVLWCIGSK